MRGQGHMIENALKTICGLLRCPVAVAIHRGSGHMTCSYHVARVPSSVISNFWFWEKGFHWYANRQLCICIVGYLNSLALLHTLHTSWSTSKPYPLRFNASRPVTPRFVFLAYIVEGATTARRHINTRRSTHPIMQVYVPSG